MNITKIIKTNGHLGKTQLLEYVEFDVKKTKELKF